MKETSNTQIAAINKARDLGELISEKFPQIQEDYKQKVTRAEIIRKYNLMEFYEMDSLNIMKTAVTYALEKLIPDKDERLKISKKVRQRSGRSDYESRKGVGAFNPKKQKNAGKKSAIVQGRIPWQNKEQGTLIELINDENYKHKYGQHEGKPDYERIRVRLYQLYGVKRSIGTIYTRVNKLKKKGLLE